MQPNSSNMIGWHVKSDGGGDNDDMMKMMELKVTQGGIQLVTCKPNLIRRGALKLAHGVVPNC